MTTNFHDEWEDGVTDFNEAEMNAPLGQLDQAITEETQWYTHKSGEITRNNNEYIVKYSASGDYRKQTRGDFLGALQTDAGYPPIVVGATNNGSLSASAVVVRFPPPLRFVFLSGMPGSYVVAEDAPDAETVFSMKKNEVEFGTVTFQSGETSGTFAAASDTTFLPGTDNVFKVVAPADPNNIGNMGWGILGKRITSGEI